MQIPKLSIAAAAHLLVGVAVASKCANPCATLAKALPGDVVFHGSEQYSESNIFWSNRQSDLEPACFVTPRKTADVAKALKLITKHRVPFSVKGGGHSAHPGASNTDGGVTIDLVHLNEITVSNDRETVSVGPGCRWINVSEVLDPQGLAVVGGRVADVGVSGLTLGGGISYFSGMRGWACDNVRAFEVVLVSGKVVTASPTKNKDLYWALRGGGGASFGIVTRFDLEAFEQGDLWASDTVYPGAMNATLVPLFADLVLEGFPADPAAHSYLVFSLQPSLGGLIALTSFFHADPPASNETVPEVFQPFKEVPNALFTSARIDNVSTLSKAIEQPYGMRQTWWDTTVRIVSADILLEVMPLFDEHLARLSAAAGESVFSPFLVFQAISSNIIRGMQKNGGNALMLDEEEPLVIVQITVAWEDATIDAEVEASCKQFIEEVDALARSKGVHKGLVYMNYAGSEQDVQRSYGEASYKRLQGVARKYDPERLLKKLWKGYFQV